MEQSSMSQFIGQYIDRYHILQQLGQGGMATVFKAYDTRLERDVAFKVIRTGVIGPDMLEQMLKRFEREAKSLAKLEHPNIVSIYDYGKHENAPYLVMQYLPGGTLKDRVGQVFPCPNAARLLLPIAHALDYAHKRSIIHRDVKPANILITENGETMLSDFGIAKILEAEQGGTLTGTGVGIGTPEYMAPEQWTGKTIPQTDIYALGVVFYELVTGHKPYTADTPAAVLLMQASDPLPRPSQFVPNIPESVEQTLFKALAKQPLDRFPTMEAFSQALEQIAFSSPPPEPDTAATIIRQPAPPPHRVEPPPEVADPPAPRGSKRIPFWAIAGGVGLALIVIVGLAALLISSLLSGKDDRAPVSTSSSEATSTISEPTGTPSSSNQDDPGESESGSVISGTIHIIGPSDDSLATLEPSLALFNRRYPDVVIEYQSLTDFQTTLVAMAEAGESPDIALIPQPDLMHQLVDMDALTPLWAEAETLVDQNYQSGWKFIGSYDDQLYGVFFNVSLKGLVWYDKTLFEAQGFPEPQSMAELMALMDYMASETDAAPWCIGIESGGASGWVGTDWMESIMLSYHPVETYDRWVSHELPFSSNEVAKAWEVMNMIWSPEGMVYGGRDTINETSFYESAVMLFDTPQRCWMYLQGDFVVSFFPAEVTQDLDNRLGVFPLPAAVDGSAAPALVTGIQYVTFSGHDRPEVRRFIEFLATVEATEPIAKINEGTFPHLGQDLDIYPSQINRDIARELSSAPNARFDGSDMMDPNVNTAFWHGVVDYVNGADINVVLQDIDLSLP
jgi:alpha-glucoside transport system substrate-binding protein